MRKTFVYILSIMLNIGLYFFLQIIASFVEFGLFGSGNASADKTFWVSFSFLIVQVLILLFLYKRKILAGTALLACNALLAICLFLYFVV